MNSHRVPVFLLAAILIVGVAGVSQPAARAQDDAGGEQAIGLAGDAASPAQSAAAGTGQGGIDNLGLIALGSIVIAGLTIAIGSIGPAFGEGRAVAQALSAIAQQPDSSNTITRTLFVGLAMIESTAIYCFVVAMILLFANPFWNHFTQ
ncbi:ATP synthase subunit c [Stieleria neptunia]|uniref:ATP synthase subunit c n=1 Tax=Stieleria neptunia TaxID=2527979 RepID=A0A518HNP4_9BACT|nr:F0F1 ATP synthase subunit C [Stieleria neptunia]QDV42462.1 ATP synthase subunit c [Stieleria neptunia]